jgi:hypothetical protein
MYDNSEFDINEFQKIRKAIIPCRIGRLKQIGPSCWFNTAINVLLLTEPIAQRLRSIWENIPEDEKIEIMQIMQINPNNGDSCPLPSILAILKKYVLYYVHDILIKGNRINSDKDLMKDMVTHSDGYSTNYNDGGYPIKALEQLLQFFFPGDVISINNDDFQGNIDEFKGNIVIFYTNTVFIKIPDTIKVLMNNNYDLQASAVLTNNKMHIVSGLRCGDIWYIYDSNNILVECDWSNADFTKYINECMALTQKKNKTYCTVDGFHYLIYIKKDFINTQPNHDQGKFI